MWKFLWLASFVWNAWNTSVCINSDEYGWAALAALAALFSLVMLVLEELHT